MSAVKSKWSPRRAWQRTRTVPGLGRDVIALAAVIAIGLAAGGLILASQNVHWPWQGTRPTVRVEFTDAVAINPDKSQEVRIAGVRVGSITAAEPTARGTSVLTLAFDQPATVYDNATAVLRPKNPLNEMYVELNPGAPPGKPLGEGATIPATRTQRPVQPEEVFDHLDERTRNALTSLLSESDVALAGAAQSLPAGLTAADHTLTGLQPVVQALQARREKIQTLVSSVSVIATTLGGDDQRLVGLLDATERTLSVLSTRDGDLNSTLRQLPGVTDQLRQAMTATTDLTGRLNPVLDNARAAAGNLPSTVDSLASAVDQLGSTVDHAAPVVAKAGPVVTALRPMAGDLLGALTDLRPVTTRLDAATVKLVPFMDGLQAFVYNTASLFSVQTAAGGSGRGEFVVTANQPLGDAGCAPKPGQPCTTGGGR